MGTDGRLSKEGVLVFAVAIVGLACEGEDPPLSRLCRCTMEGLAAGSALAKDCFAIFSSNFS